ncbi:hypothetical protein N7504_005868 [Penicillium tannophilum]|nr:hypothetical protein N7504_005868 [Penicillium tannophilum]
MLVNQYMMRISEASVNDPKWNNLTRSNVRPTFIGEWRSKKAQAAEKGRLFASTIHTDSGHPQRAALVNFHYWMTPSQD